MPSEQRLIYRPTPTGDLFHRCSAGIKGVRGCVGSGKSVMCVEDMFFKSNAMPANPYDGVRRSKWLIIRSTYQELRDTTIPTLLAWFPMIKMRWGQVMDGRISGMPAVQNDGTTLDIMYKFLALDRPNDIEKLKSFEASGVWANEAGAIPWSFLAVAYQRTGRYPKADREAGVRYPGLGMIMDTNPPSDTSWWYRFAEIQKPRGMKFFCQPPALLRREEKGKVFYVPNKGQDPGIPEAENVENHNEGYNYWLKQTLDGDHNRIKVFVLGEYGVDISGEPVYPEYRDQKHYANAELKPIPGLPIFLGTDFGRTPATAICQITPFGQLRIMDELCTHNLGITQFTREVLIPKLMNEYNMHSVGVFNFADPAGNDKGQIDDQTCINVMRSLGVNTVASPVYKNSFQQRRESVANRLNTDCDGQPGLIISSKCPMIRSGFQGRYYYKKVNAADAGEERTASEPQKNMFSHIHDGLQYVSCGLDSPSSKSLFDGYQNPFAERMGVIGMQYGNTGARVIDTKMNMNGFY